MSIIESERVQELLVRAGLGELSPRTVRAGLAVVALVGALAVWRFWPSAPAPEIAFAPDAPASEASAAGAPTATGSGAAPPASEATGEPQPMPVVVHVAGCVARPGVYALDPGSRVADAVTAAGGPLADAATESINLARLLIDGEQVYLPSAEEVASGAAVGAGAGAGAAGAAGGAAGGATAGPAAAAGDLVNVNTASAAELEALPGVGPSTAQKIVADREKNGPFLVPEDLMRVPGIGPKKFEAMADLVTCG